VDIDAGAERWSRRQEFHRQYADEPTGEQSETGEEDKRFASHRSHASSVTESAKGGGFC